jgi:lipopolysaccharide export LptBFGC system permease protein LptF
MDQTPEPLDKRRLPRPSTAGVVLAALGLMLFLFIWFSLENVGIDQVPRLVLSVCAPPGLIALIAGIYFLVIQPQNKG